MVIIWSCRAKGLSGKGLGRSLGDVGLNQISLSMMLRAALVHKLPCGAISCVFAWGCRAKAALQNYFLSFCMELLFKTCSAKLFLELWHGTVLQKLPCEAIAEAFACNCRAKAALQNFVLSFCVELSCKSGLPMLFHKLLHAAIVQNMPFQAIFHAPAWHYRIRVAF